MKFLIIGLGSIGQRHVQNLAATGDHEFLAYRVRENPLPNGAPFDSIRVIKDLDEALSEKPDATLVCGPTATHIEVAQRVVDSGSNLFIEKPLSNNLDGLDKLVENANQKKLISLVGFNLRFHSPLKRLRHAILEGKIGEIQGLRCQVGQYLPNWHPDEDYRQSYSAQKSLGGGVVLDLIHEIDLAIWIAGLPTEVSAFTSRVSNLEIDTENTAEIIMRMPNKALVNVHMDYLQNPASRSLLAYGSEGSIEWNGTTDEVILSPSSGTPEKIWTKKEDRNNSFVEMMNSFLASISNGSESAVPLEEALKSQIIANAAYTSDESGKSIKLSW
jgi:predicted dehydrogenase